jgi:hypothetical protein
MEERTLEEFVEDMVSDGRSLGDIRAVARSTRWETKMLEVLDYAKTFKKVNKRLHQ